MKVSRGKSGERLTAMLDFPRWKMWAVSLLCLFGIAMAVPSFFPESVVAKWPAFVPSARINLGLDLAGGSHLLLEGDTSDVAKQRLDQMEDIMRSELRRAKIEVGDMSTADGADVLQWADNGTADHRWTLLDQGDGTYKIRNGHSGKHIDLE